MAKLNTKAVHNEMENYIHQSQLDDLVSSIIGELFVKKSSNLVAFVINYLHRYHYDKVHDIIKEIKLPDKSYSPSKQATNLNHDDYKVLNTKDSKLIIEHYIDSRDVTSFFSTVVETILLSKPKNIPLFLVDYLMKTYPDQGYVAIYNIQRHIDGDIEGPSILSMKSMSQLQFQEAMNDANTNRQQKSSRDDVISNNHIVESYIDSGNIHGGNFGGDVVDGDDVKLYDISKDDENQNDKSGAGVGDDSNDQDLYF